MDITLKPEQEKFIESLLNQGKYENAEQVISEALKLLEERNCQPDEKRLEELRQKIAVGIKQILKGQVKDKDATLTQLQTKIKINSCLTNE